MDKINEQLLLAFKRANKERREKLAKKYGFKSANEYLNHLLGDITESVNIPKETIHNVFILDASGSMIGSKYNNAVIGINQLIKDIKQDTYTNNTISVVEFDSIPSKNPNITKPSWMSNPNMIKGFNGGGAYGSTPLYKTLGIILNELESEVKSSDKVLVNIFTDGDDTEGYGNFKNLPQTIERLNKTNYTITFVGTQQDVNRSINTLNIDASNTLIHNNTAEAVIDSFLTTSVARTAYSVSVANGEDVLIGFYKKTGKL